MTTSDLILVAVSAIVIGGLYLIGRYSRKARQRNVAPRNE